MDARARGDDEGGGGGPPPGTLAAGAPRPVAGSSLEIRLLEDRMDVPSSVPRLATEEQLGLLGCIKVCFVFSTPVVEVYKDDDQKDQ